MKVKVLILLLMLTALPFYLPWWVQSVVLFVFGFTCEGKVKNTILISMASVFAVNFGTELYLTSQAQNRLAFRISEMLYVSHPLALALLGAVLLALPCGSFSYCGSTLRKLMSGNSALA